MGNVGGWGNQQNAIPPVATMAGDNPYIAPSGLQNSATPQAQMGMYNSPLNNAGWQGQSSMYTPTAAPTYMQSNAQKLIPTAKSAADLVGDANAAEGMLDPSLQMNASNTRYNMNDPTIQAYQQDFINNNVNPMLASQANASYMKGRSNSSFGGAQQGAAAVSGASAAMHAGMDLFQQQFGNLMQSRDSFFKNSGAVSQTSEQNRLNQGNQKANMVNQNNQFQNSFNQEGWKNQNAFASGSAGQAWDRQQGLWGRDQQLWNRAQETSKTLQAQNKGATSSILGAGSAVANAVRSF